MDYRELLQAYPHLEMPTQLCLAGRYGRSIICFHNYYDQIFRDAETPVDLHLAFFDGQGNQVAGVREPVATGGFAQFDAASLELAEPGLVAVMAVPAFDLAKLSAGKLKLRKSIGTGFYVIWRDNAGHVDTMHEWAPVRRGPLPAARYHMVFDGTSGRLDDVALVLSNPVAAPEASMQAHVTIYNRDRRELGSATLPALPPMGARIEGLRRVFPDLERWFADHGVLGCTVRAVNLVEPFSMEIHRSGDFHIHHIN